MGTPAGRLDPLFPSMDFSICIPVFNREKLVLRALRSCLNQAGPDFEIIVVDDGSTDGTAAAVESVAGSCLRLIRHPTNRGQCAARNTCVDAATGDWVVMLDSDDELMPDALPRVARLVKEMGGAVDCLAFMQRRDDGGFSPEPALRNQIWDYEGYIRWLEDRVFFDCLHCTRRSTFERVRWREWQVAGRVLYFLDFHRHFKTFASAETMSLFHSDAANRISWQRRKPEMASQAGRDLGAEMDAVLTTHGAALQKFAPKRWRHFEAARASYHFLTGSRWDGLRRIAGCLQRTPLQGDLWLQLVTGLLGPAVFSRFRSLRPPPT
jgi:glycosyltransferase involved in cell wall biosynthesis